MTLKPWYRNLMPYWFIALVSLTNCKLLITFKKNRNKIIIKSARIKTSVLVHSSREWDLRNDQYGQLWLYANILFSRLNLGYFYDNYVIGFANGFSHFICNPLSVIAFDKWKVSPWLMKNAFQMASLMALFHCSFCSCSNIMHHLFSVPAVNENAHTEAVNSLDTK